MAHGTTNHGRVCRTAADHASACQSGRLTRAGRRACGEAGRRNLEAWRARKSGAADIAQRVAEFRAGLLGELGPEATAAQQATVEAAVTIYGGICRAQARVLHCREKALPGLLDRIPRLSGNLLRLLKSLGLRDKRRPRTLSEVFDSKVGRNSPI